VEKLNKNKKLEKERSDSGKKLWVFPIHSANMPPHRSIVSPYSHTHNVPLSTHPHPYPPAPLPPRSRFACSRATSLVSLLSSCDSAPPHSPPFPLLLYALKLLCRLSAPHLSPPHASHLMGEERWQGEARWLQRGGPRDPMTREPASSCDGEIRLWRIRGDDVGGDGGTNGSVRSATGAQIHGNGDACRSRYPPSLVVVVAADVAAEPGTPLSFSRWMWWQQMWSDGGALWPRAPAANGDLRWCDKGGGQ
jgi:hypothetical protein